MPGPGKGYISKKDPRRKEWEKAQGTSAGGGYYTEGVVPDTPYVAPGSSTPASVNTVYGTSATVESSTGAVTPQRTPLYQALQARRKSEPDVEASVPGLSAEANTALEDMVGGEQEDSLMSSLAGQMAAAERRRKTPRDLTNEQFKETRGQLDFRTKEDKTPMKRGQGIPGESSGGKLTSVFRNTSEMEQALFGQPVTKKKIKGLKTRLDKQIEKVDAAGQEYVNTFDMQGERPSKKDVPLPGVNFAEQQRVRSNWNDTFEKAKTVEGKYVDARNTPRPLTQKDRANDVVNQSMASWKRYEKEFEGQTRQSIAATNPWRGVTKDTPNHVKRKILRSIQEKEIDPAKQESAPDRSFGEFAEDAVDTVSDFLKDNLGGVAGPTAGYTAGGGKVEVDTPKVIPSPIRDLLRPEEEEGTLQSVMPYERQKEYEASGKKMAYNIGALDSESPIDQALTALSVAGAAGVAGRTLAGAGRGAKAAAGAAASDEYATKLGKLFGVSKSGLNVTRTGKRVKRYRNFMAEPLRARKFRKVSDDWGNLFKQDDFAEALSKDFITRAEAARRAKISGAAGAGVAGAVAADDPVGVAVGTLTANPLKAGETTLRSLMSMFTTPLAIAAAGAQSGRNVVGLSSERVGGPDSVSEAFAPITTLASEYGDELTGMWDAYMHGNADQVREYTEDQMGYIGPMVGGVLAGAGFRHLGSQGFQKSVGKNPYVKPWKKEAGVDYPTINEELTRRGILNRQTVIEARGEAQMDQKVKRVLHRVQKEAQKLNRTIFSTHAAATKEFQAAVHRELKDQDTGADTPEIGWLDMALLPLNLGREGGVLTPQDVADLRAGMSMEGNPGLETMLNLYSSLPKGFYNKNSKVGKKVKKIQDLYRKDVQPYLSDELKGENALKLDSMITLQKIMEGKERSKAVKEGRAGEPATPAFVAPEHPARVGEKAYEKEKKVREDKVKAVEKDQGRVQKLEAEAKSARAKLDKMKSVETQIRTIKGELVKARRRGDDAKVAGLEKTLIDLNFVKAQKKKGPAMKEREAEVKKMEADAKQARAEWGQRDYDAKEAVKDWEGQLSSNELNELRADYRLTDSDSDEAFRKREAKQKKAAEKALVDNQAAYDKENEKIKSAEKKIAVYEETANPDSAKGFESKGQEKAMKKAAKEAKKIIEEARQEKVRLKDTRLRLEENVKSFIRDQAFSNAVKQKKMSNKMAHQRRLEAEAQLEFDRKFKEAQEDYGTVLAAYNRWVEEPDHWERNRALLEKELGHAVTNPQMRLGSAIAFDMKVDRRWAATLKAVQDKAQREKDRNMAAYVERNGMWSRKNPKTGRNQLYFTMGEIKALPKEIQRKLRRTHVLIDEASFRETGEGPWQGMFGRDGEPNVNWPSDEASLAASGGRQGQRVAIVERGIWDYMENQHKDLTKFGAALEKFGRLQSKLTLGTSVGWLMTQPLAEMLTLMASHPNPAAFIRQHEARGKILRDDPEAASLLRYAAGTTIGTNVVTTRMLEDHNAVGRAVKMQKQSPEGEFLRQTARLEVLGELDRKKGAYIREVGTLMEIESNLRGAKRTAKATLGSMDAIEKVADKLAPMTQAKRLQYMYSPQGIRDGEHLTNNIRDALKAGEQIIENVDRQQGNWNAITPGWQQGFASAFFFYPFTRFSLNWTFRTYPRDHPVRWSVLAMLGGFNANMVEDILGGEPSFFSGWAQVPIYDNEGKVVSLLPVSRAMHTSNAIVETIGSFEGPEDILGPLSPGIKTAIDFFGRRDAYGNELLDDEGEKLGFIGRVGEAADRFLSLSPIYRELKRQGIHVDAEWLNAVGEWAGVPVPDALTDKIGKIGFADGREQRVGDDPDETLSFMRRQFGPMGDIIYGTLAPGATPGLHIEPARAKVAYDKMFDMHIEQSKIADADLSDKAQQAFEKDDAWNRKLYANKQSKGWHWEPKLKWAEETFRADSPRYLKVLTAWKKEEQKYLEWQKTSKNYQLYRREQEKIDQAQENAETAAYFLDKMTKEAGIKDPPPVDSTDVENGKARWNSPKTQPVERVWDPYSGQLVIKGGPKDRNADSRGPYAAAVAPQGARAWRHLGTADTLAWEDSEGNIRRPGDEVEDLLTESWNDYPGKLGPNLINARIKEFRLTKEIEKAQEIVARPIPKQSEADERRQLQLERQGTGLKRKGIITGNRKQERQGDQLLSQAEDLKRETSGEYERQEKAEAKRIIASNKAAIKALPDWRNPKDNKNQGQAGSNVSNLSGKTIKASPKRQRKVANRILDLKEQLNQGGGGVRRDSDVPNWLIPKYVKAAKKYGLGPDGPAMLAAINSIETRFGELNEVTSSAGAQGWMQFMPGTWAAYGVDADGKGGADPYDPDDAIHSAANYLKANNAPNDWYNALFRYNNADWYVKDVQGRAENYYAPMNKRDNKKIERRFEEAVALGKAMGIYEVKKGEKVKGKYAYPLAKEGVLGSTPADHANRAMGNWMSDNAVDITIPPNTPVTAVTDQVVTRLSGSAPNPTGNPAGWTVYAKDANGEEYSYMHLNRMDVEVGDRLNAGQQLGLSGTANSVDHLHFAVKNGDPTAMINGEPVNGGRGSMMDQVKSNRYPDEADADLANMIGSSAPTPGGAAMPGTSTSPSGGSTAGRGAIARGLGAGAGGRLPTTARGLLEEFRYGDAWAGGQQDEESMDMPLLAEVFAGINGGKKRKAAASSAAKMGLPTI